MSADKGQQPWWVTSLGRVSVLALATVLCARIVSGQPARIELYPIQTVTLSTPQFLMGNRSGKPALIAGELRLPTGGNDRVPAVVLVHGSAGPRTNVDTWATQFNSRGIAAFILDTFTGRGITNTSADQTQLDSLAMTYDAYRALEILAKHPSIDPRRIAVMGFSKGAVTAVYSSLARFNKLQGTPGLTFAAHIGLYTPCYTTYFDDTVTTGKPIRLLHGTSDDLVPVAACRTYVQRLKAAGNNAQLIEYPNAWHNFDLPAPTLIDRKGQNTSACRLEEKAGGQIVNVETSKLFSYSDRCVSQDAHTGYSPNAHAGSIRDVSRFLTETFGLKQ